MVIGNRTSCHPILSVIIQVIDKLDSRFAVVITFYDYLP